MVEWKKLGEVCEVLNGFAFKSNEYVDEGIRVIRISDVQSGYLSNKDKVYYPTVKKQEIQKQLLHAGDLVMSLTGNPGRVALIDEENCALNQRVACLRTEGNLKSFLFYLFNSKDFENIAFANSTGGAQKNLSTTWLKNFLIPIPSLQEQERIVGILDTFTASIDNLKAQIEQRRKQYEHYRDQLLDLEGKEGVEMKKLGEVCTIARGASPRPIKNYITKDVNGVNWIKIGDVTPEAKYITSAQEKITPEGAKKSRFLHVGDFILSNSMSFGRPYILKIEGCIHDGWIAMSGYDKYVSSGYLYEILNSVLVQNYWKQKANNGGAMTNLNSDIVKGTSIPLPSLQEQERIVGILDTFEASIANLEAQLEQRQKQYEYYREKLLTFER